MELLARAAVRDLISSGSDDGEVCVLEPRFPRTAAPELETE